MYDIFTYLHEWWIFMVFMQVNIPSSHGSYGSGGCSTLTSTWRELPTSNCETPDFWSINKSHPQLPMRAWNLIIFNYFFCFGCDFCHTGLHHTLTRMITWYYMFLFYKGPENSILNNHHFLNQFKEYHFAWNMFRSVSCASLPFLLKSTKKKSPLGGWEDGLPGIVHR